MGRRINYGKIKNKMKELCAGCFDDVAEYYFMKSSLFSNSETILCAECLKLRLIREKVING